MLKLNAKLVSSCTHAHNWLWVPEVFPRANPALEEGGNYLGSTRKSLGSTHNNEKQLVAFYENVMEKCAGAFCLKVNM